MIIQKLNDLIQELSSNEQLVQNIVELGEPIRSKNYKTVESEIGYDLQSLFDMIFSIHREIELVFSSKDDEVICECSIEGLQYIFNEAAQTKRIHAFDDFDPRFKELCKTLYPLDIYQKSFDAVTLTAVKIISATELEFWIWNNSGQKYKLLFKTFIEYFEAGVDSKFIVGWQYFYLDKSALNFEDQFTREWLAHSLSAAKFRALESLDRMKTYFPKTDWRFYSDSLNEF